MILKVMNLSNLGRLKVYLQVMKFRQNMESALIRLKSGFQLPKSIFQKAKNIVIEIFLESRIIKGTKNLSTTGFRWKLGIVLSFTSIRWRKLKIHLNQSLLVGK